MAVTVILDGTGHGVVVSEIVRWEEFERAGTAHTMIHFKNGTTLQVRGMHGAAIQSALSVSTQEE